MVRRSVEVEVFIIVQTFVQQATIYVGLLSQITCEMTELHSICATIFMITYEIQ